MFRWKQRRSLKYKSVKKKRWLVSGRTVLVLCNGIQFWIGFGFFFFLLVKNHLHRHRRRRHHHQNKNRNATVSSSVGLIELTRLLTLFFDRFVLFVSETKTRPSFPWFIRFFSWVFLEFLCFSLSFFIRLVFLLSSQFHWFYLD